MNIFNSQSRIRAITMGISHRSSVDSKGHHRISGGWRQILSRGGILSRIICSSSRRICLYSKIFEKGKKGKFFTSLKDYMRLNVTCNCAFTPKPPPLPTTLAFFFVVICLHELMGNKIHKWLVVCLHQHRLYSFVGGYTMRFSIKIDLSMAIQNGIGSN